MLRYDLANSLGRKSTALVCYASHIDLFTDPMSEHDVCWVGYKVKLRKQAAVFRTRHTLLTLYKVFHLFCPEDNDRLLHDHMHGHMSAHNKSGKNTVWSVIELAYTACVCVCVGECGSLFFSCVCEGEAGMRSSPESRSSFMISSAVFYGDMTFLCVTC